MRKKYLSALLFGALLVTSAGTFTSCKDYDDEINDLQEQINTINTTLTELKGQIGDKGVSSVTFDEATGMLTVVDANGSKSYKIQTSAETVIDAIINEEGVLVINGEEIGKVLDGGDTVTVDENNNLLVNGEIVANLNKGEAGMTGSVIKDEVNHTVTITIDGESVVLPYGADAGITPSVELELNGAEYAKWNVNWGIAEEKIEWNDTEIAAGSLLLGGMTQFATVNVSPITYDLSAQTLKLVDMDGKDAPVKVVPATKEAQATTGSRAISNDGAWTLSLSMLETVTEKNIETVFTKEVNGVAQNLRYALTVNGTRVTGYNFVIDTQTKNESDVNEALTKDNFTGKTATVSTGEVTLSVADFADKTADGTIEPADAEVLSNIVASTMTLADINAEAAGVKVEGMKVTIPSTFSGQTITVKLTVLDVTGAKSERTATIKVNAASVDEVSQVKQVEVKISTDGKFTVEFGDIFSKLDASVVKAIKGYKLTTADQNFFALNSLVADENIYTINSNSGISFLKSDKKTYRRACTSKIPQRYD